MSIAELDLTPRGRGRAPKVVSAGYVRDLGPGDLALLATERGIKAPPIKALRDRHHALARALASGMMDYEASAVTGYGPARISILKADPTFQELIAHYREVKDSAFAEFQDRAAVLATTAVNRLQEVLEDDDEPVSASMALEIAKFAADRTGNAPVTKSLNVSATMDFGSRLAEARKRVEAAKLLELPEATFEEKNR